MPAITLALEARGTEGAVRLTINSAPDTGVVITRTDRNGQGTVRLLTGQAPVGGLLVVDDDEVALGGPVTYRVAPSPQDATYTPATASIDLDGVFSSSWLGVPITPSLNIPIRSILTYGHTRTSRSVLHQIIGRADLVAALARPGMRAGAIGMFAATVDEVFQLDAVLARADVLHLRQNSPARLDMYFTMEQINVRPADVDTPERRWLIDVNYQEVAAPISRKLGTLDWTVQAMLDAYATVSDVAAAFATVAAAAAGPTDG